MKRPDRRKRHRLAVAATVVSFVGLGLATPFIIAGMNPDPSFQSAAVVAATRDSFTLTSPIALGAIASFKLDRGTVSMMPSGPGDVMTGATTLALLASGKAKLKVDDATVTLDLRELAGSYIEGKPALDFAPVLSALINMQFAELALNNSELVITRADGSVEVLSGVQLTVARQRNGRVKAAGTFVFRNRPLEVAAAFTTEPAGEDGLPPLFPLEMSLKGEFVDIRGNGSMSIAETPRIEAREAEIAVTSVRDLAAWLGTDWGPGNGFGKLVATGPLEWTPRGISMPQARVEIDGNVAEGAVALRLAQQRAAIDGTLDFETLDLSPYLDPAKKPTAFSPFDFSSLLPRRFVNRPLMPMLQDIDADLRVSASKVMARGASFGRAAASVSLKDGVMLTDLAELEIGKSGRCTGQLSLTASGDTAQYRLKGRVGSIDVASVAGAIWPHTAIAGIGELAVDVSASGSDRGSLMQSAVGKVSVKLPAAGQLGVDLKTLAATARAEVLQGWGGAARGSTQVDSLSAQLVLEGGRLWADKVVAKSGDTTLTALGSVHIDGGLADLQIWMTHPAKPDSTEVTSAAISGAPASADAPNGAANDAMLAGAGLLIRGPVHSPSIRFLRLSERRDLSRPHSGPLTVPGPAPKPAGTLPDGPAATTGKRKLQLPATSALVAPAQVPITPAMPAGSPDSASEPAASSSVTPAALEPPAALPRATPSEPALAPVEATREAAVAPKSEPSPAAAATAPESASPAPPPAEIPPAVQPERAAAVAPEAAEPSAATPSEPAGPAILLPAPSPPTAEPDREAAAAAPVEPRIPAAAPATAQAPVVPPTPIPLEPAAEPPAWAE